MLLHAGSSSINHFKVNEASETLQTFPQTRVRWAFFEQIEGCNYDGSHTPADAEVNVEVVPLGEDGDDQKTVQIQALHQQPAVVGHHAVLHHHHGNTTASHSLRNACNMQIQPLMTHPLTNHRPSDVRKNVSHYENGWMDV